MSVFRTNAYATPVAEAAVRSDFPDFSFGVFRDPPRQVWSDFVHSTDEFVVVVEGEVEIEVAGRSAVCTPGDLVVIPAGASHTLRTSPEAGSVWFYGYGTIGGGNG